jgi:uncharacterized phage protein (TIGR01671 family)
MRQILFRGQTRKYGEKVLMGTGEKLPGKWVYGGIFPGENKSIIYGCSSEKITSVDLEKHVVYSDTVGQYTGLEDKNGVKVFEGDIIKTHYANAKICDFVEIVVFRGGRFCSEKNLPGGGRMWAPLWDGVPHISQDTSLYVDSMEVIGNIYDNPEMVTKND